MYLLNCQEYFVSPLKTWPKIENKRQLTRSPVKVWVANLTFPNVPLPNALPITKKGN